MEHLESLVPCMRGELYQSLRYFSRLHCFHRVGRTSLPREEDGGSPGHAGLPGAGVDHLEEQRSDSELSHFQPGRPTGGPGGLFLEDASGQQPHESVKGCFSFENAV